MTRPLPDARECRHPHGDYVSEIAPWVCGICFAKLGDRPTRYGISNRGDVRADLQRIVWQAEILTSAEGTTLRQYLRTMAKRYQLKSRDPLSDADAFGLALEFLKGLGDPFGDPAYDWSHAGAREMADEDMAEYWEQVAGGTN